MEVKNTTVFVRINDIKKGFVTNQRENSKCIKKNYYIKIGTLIRKH